MTDTYYNYIGTVRRRCIREDLWEEFFECFREETQMLFNQVISIYLKIDVLLENDNISGC